jgi:hypothetical protein
LKPYFKDPFKINFMTNNDILKKLRVALMLRDTDIEAIMSLVDFKISTSELGAFFRSEDHPKYMECGDQILRNFLNGLIIYTRGTKEAPKKPADALLHKPVMAKAKMGKCCLRNKNQILRPKKPFKKGPKGPPDLSFVAYKNKKKS